MHRNYYFLCILFFMYTNSKSNDNRIRIILTINYCK